MILLICMLWKVTHRHSGETNVIPFFHFYAETTFCNGLTHYRTSFAPEISLIKRQ